MIKNLVFHSTKRTFFSVINQYSKGVRFNFGKFGSIVEPGIRLNIPFYHEIIEFDMRDMIGDIPNQQLISKDNISFQASASIHYKISDIEKSVLNVYDIRNNIIEKTIMEMRNVLTSRDINDILLERNVVSQEIKDSLMNTMEYWGVHINSIQIKSIEFDENMKRALSVKAEADRNAEAKIINARSDVETAKQYAEASKIYTENPITMRLREFQLWQQVAKNPSSSIFVVPSNILDFVKK